MIVLIFVVLFLLKQDNIVTLPWAWWPKGLVGLEFCMAKPRWLLRGQLRGGSQLQFLSQIPPLGPFI